MTSGRVSTIGTELGCLPLGLAPGCSYISCELDLAAGMTALTGETGAGKSILIDALGLALGRWWG